MPDIFSASATNTSAVTPAPNKPNIIPPANKNTGNAFSAFRFMPTNLRFETQEQEETIILFLRKHWITNLNWILLSVILIITPLIIFPLLTQSTMLPVQIASSVISFLILVWYLLSFSYTLIQFITWYFTVSIITNERIIDIDLVNVLNKKLSETRVALVEDVTENTRGFLGAIFDYGDVVVQTAAKEQEFFLDAVPHPEKVVQILNELMGKEEDEHSPVG
jgi:hypothetical protein